MVLWVFFKVNQSGGLLVTGFKDGVVRLLELYDPQRLHAVVGRSPKGDAKLQLKQAFKPHNAPVTAVAYERNGEILATGVRGFLGKKGVLVFFAMRFVKMLVYFHKTQ